MTKTLTLATVLALTALTSLATAPASAAPGDLQTNFNRIDINAIRLPNLTCRLRPTSPACRAQNGPHTTQPGTRPGTQAGPRQPQGGGRPGNGSHGGHGGRRP
jgi:hypothetical protein